MWRLRYYRLATCAWVRGLFYRWPQTAPNPRGYSTVSCGMTGPESRDMYRKHGWEPWSFQRAPGYGISRLFRVKETDPNLWSPTAQEWLEDMDDVPF